MVINIILEAADNELANYANDVAALRPTGSGAVGIGQAAFG